MLREIVAHKRTEVAAAIARTPLRELEGMVAQEEPGRNFFRAVTRAGNGTAVIAEIKRRSPSAGPMRPEYEGDGFRPESIAQAFRIDPAFKPTWGKEGTGSQEAFSA